MNVCEDPGKSHPGRQVPLPSSLVKLLWKVYFSALLTLLIFVLAGMCVTWLQFGDSNGKGVCGQC